MGGSKKDGQTIGYNYYFSILFGLGRQVNEVRTIMVADKIAWQGPSGCSGAVQAIQKPELFGGEKKEGGIQGRSAFCSATKTRSCRVTARRTAAAAAPTRASAC
jgi:hypothetical protein